jgi:hypothetical protein
LATVGFRYRGLGCQRHAEVLVNPRFRRCARALAATLIACTLGCMPKSETTKAEPFADDFARTELGPRYVKQGGTWSIVDGALHSSGERNIPLWLDVPLAKNTRVEFVAWSKSPAVDTKIEIFGDGVRHESGYIVILAGWNNTISTIARLDEHEPTRVEKRTRFEPDRKYRWRVERTDGRRLAFFLDDALLLAYDDGDPLVGDRHSRLGFTNWASDVYYDDLVVTPLPD